MIQPDEAAGGRKPSDPVATGDETPPPPATRLESLTTPAGDATRPDPAPIAERRKDAGDSAWVKGQVILKEFEVEDKLGEGGMGIVHLVRSRFTGTRFAVKRTHQSDPVSRGNFLKELQTWIDLPEHPHLVACRFFKTLANETLIFAEYVEGGSLAEWVRKRKLTSLEQVLDVAIQFAWGLHVAHMRGLIHQDVKPGNALLTPEGVVKVSDFGLARARKVAGEQPIGTTGQSILLSCGGMTPAYCSPEQADGRPLSSKTDVWSWGLSVLEMFTGEVTWLSGTGAAKVLEGYLEAGMKDERLPAMPSEVAEVLRKCFRPDPTERWKTLTEAAEPLKGIFRQETGHDYTRSAREAEGPSGRPAASQDRWNRFGRQNTDPKEWLLEAFQAEGRDPAKAESFLPAQTASRKAHAIGDLAVFEEARRIFERLVVAGRKDLETRLAILCCEKALAHERAGDAPGAVALVDQSIEILKRLLHEEERSELVHHLVMAFAAKVVLVSESGDDRTAVTLCNQAIEICERFVQHQGRSERLFGKPGQL